MLLQVVSFYIFLINQLNSLHFVLFCTFILLALGHYHHISNLAEYGQGGQVSVAGDSYSFGITLLEMFTGRAPTDDMFRKGLSLHLFAEMAFPDKISEIIDPILLHVEQFEKDARLYIALDCITSAISVGISCSKQAPSERMSMKNAAATLHRIRDSVFEYYV